MRQPAAENDLVPGSASDDLDFQNTQRYLARTYAKYGTGVLLKLMPPEAMRALGHHNRRRSMRWGGGWNVRRMLGKPTTLLFMLITVFVLFVLWDSWSSSSSGAAAGPSLASLHMAPFATTSS